MVADTDSMTCEREHDFRAPLDTYLALPEAGLFERESVQET